MRKLFFSIILMAFGLSAFAQLQPKYAHFIPAYPPVVGESTYNNLVFTHNGLYLHDVILDSLPHYEIEYIPDQTVRDFENGIGFYVKADSLHSNQVVYSYEVDVPPIGPFEFNATTGRFKFYPNTGDYQTFHVTFTATAGLRSLTQTVEFVIMPETVPEEYAIQNLGEMPSTQEYTIIAESHTQMYLNNTTRTVYSYSISGKDIIFDNNVQNKVWGLSGREDLYELNVFAERLYVRSALMFPHTNVNIYAREIIFEDNGSEIASINTTPSAIATLTNETGLNGENAGNITLYINKLTANYAKRFILNGARGQCTNRNGTPGNGGNGGVLSAPIHIEGYCDFARGSAGVKYDVEGRAGHGPIIGAGQAGMNGHFEIINAKYSWIHPYYIAAVIRHINDSYLNNYFSYSKTTANDYFNLINEFEASEEWEGFDGTLKVELQDQATELQGMLYQLNENLDYFGNPLGWTPLLSFEVYLNNYNNEINRAMPTLYLNYWLQHIDQTMERWVTASQVAASQTQSDIVASQGQINSLTNDIPVLEDNIAILQSQIEETQNRLEQLKAELMSKAKHNVKKKNRLNKAFGICKAVAACIPGYGPIISSGLSIAGSFFGVADTYGYESTLMNAYTSFTDFDYGSALDNLQDAINGIDLDDLGHTGDQLKDSYQQLASTITPVYNSIMSLHQTFAQSSAPDAQVQAEFDKLCSESAEFQSIKAEIVALQQSYAKFASILSRTFVNIVNLTSEVSNELVTLDALRNDVFQGNSKRDLQAMQCIEKMRQRAMNRLVKYHYYMRKAYEYRLLRPYQGEYSLESMYNRIEAMIDQGQIIFDNSTPANITDYSALSAVFREELSGIIEDVIDELTYNTHENSASVPIVVPKEILDKINANEEYDLNLFELGLFSPEEENVRITGFGVQYMETHTVGNTGMTTYMDIELKHTGISRFRKDGEVYWFNHISQSTQNLYPNTWKIRYNPLSQQTTEIGPSYAVQSLLYSILNTNGNTNNIMLFSRPAAWSDIIMTKNVHTSGNADVVIDSLILNLQYDYTPRPDAIRNIDIATSDDLLPYITCSEADRNGRSNGKGTFHRSYTRSHGTVTFTAPEKHGTYHFVNWTDRFGNVASGNTELTINKWTDQYYMANYERQIPVISVADTIYVGGAAGEYEVQIRNVGSGDIEMDWYVSDSLSTWVHVNGVPEGIDDGYFTFYYEAIGNQNIRIDSLEILAPEIEGMSKTIYIVQDKSLRKVDVSIDPEDAGTVAGAGFYEAGSVCTLTATANEGYTFVNWTRRGVEISTEAVLSFTVTNNIAFVANFESNAITQTTNLSRGWNWYSTYIEQEGIDGLSQLENSIGVPKAIIQSQNDGYVKSILRNGRVVWGGALGSINNEEMYKIGTKYICEATMEGQVTNPASHPITINRGWNWIGFPCDHSVSVSEALSRFRPKNGDVIKGIHSVATFNSGTWSGTLNTLEPGRGYMYGSKDRRAKTLVFQTGNRGEATLANITPKNNYYQPVDDYADNMTVIAVVELDGEELRSEAYELAAFAGDECRGSVKLMYIAPIDRYVAFLTVFGDEAEDLHFVLTDGYDKSQSADHIQYETDAIEGSLDNPVTLRFGTTDINENVSANVRIYPNPSEGVFNIEGNNIRKVEVFNALGQPIYSMEAENGFLKLDLTNRASGIYLIRVITSDGICNRQVMKK